MGRNINSRVSKKIAITGGIAAGKTTVCQLFEELGAYVVSADLIVHQLLVPSTQLGQKIIALLGEDIVDGNKLSPESIAQKVFGAPLLLRELEKYIHPEVQKVIIAKHWAASEKNIPFFVAEVPLLYEANLESFYDSVIVVTADKRLCQMRFPKGEKDYLHRNNRLMPIEEKIKKANYVIANNGTLDELREKIQFIYIELKEKI